MTRGFAAITSVLVASLLLMMLAISASTDAFYSYLEQAERNSYHAAERAAMVCGLLSSYLARIDVERVRVSMGPFFVGRAETCTARHVSTDASKALVQTVGRHEVSHSQKLITVQLLTGAILTIRDDL